MIVAEDAQAHIQGLAIEGFRLVEFSLCAEDGGEVVEPAGDGVGGRVGVGVLAREGLPAEGLGFVKPAEVVEDAGEVVLGVRQPGWGTVGVALLKSQGAAEVILGAIIEAESLIGSADGNADCGFDVRKARAVVFELVGGEIEGLADGDVLPCAAGGVGGGEHVLEEGEDALGAGVFAEGLVAGDGGLPRGHQGEGEGADERAGDGEGGGDGEAVPADKLAPAIPEGVAMGGDG